MILPLDEQPSAEEVQTATVTPIAEGEVVGAPPLLLPEGEYTAEFLYHETATAFRDSKLYMHFRILDFGEYFGKQLFRAYRVKGLKGAPRKSGAFKLGRRSELYLMIMRVLPRERRIDRVSLYGLKDKRLRIRVRTVTRDYRNRDLPEPLRYSVVDDVLCIQEA